MVDRQTRNGRSLVSTSRPLRLQEVAKSGAMWNLQGLSWKPRVHSLLEYKYSTLGHFHTRGEPPLEISLEEKGSTSLVMKNLWKPFLEAEPAELEPYNVLKEDQRVVFTELLLRGSKRIKATSILIEWENQGYTGSIQDLSKISILSILLVVVSFLDTLIRKYGMSFGFGIPVRNVVTCHNVGYLYTRVCVWLLWKQVCVCVCCCLKKRVCVLNIVGKFLTLWGSGRRSRGTEPL